MQHCSVLSAERAEPMAGTAFTQAGLLLVEQPGSWGRQGLADSDFDPEVARLLDRRADRAGLRLLAIRRPERSEDKTGARRWAVRPPGSTTTFWSTYDEDADLLEIPLDGGAGDPDTEPQYLVCTHSKRDACCAVFARPVAIALDRLRPGRVWGCSHTGGHRFAPVVVALPTGSADVALYGRVGEQDLSGIVAATEDGRVVPELLRGLTGRPSYVQAALAHVLAEHPVPEDWQVDAVDETTADSWLVRVSGPSSYDLTVVAETRPEPMVSCGKPEPSDQTRFRVLSSPSR